MNDLRNELERLAERGPHREPSHVVGDALDDLVFRARSTETTPVARCSVVAGSHRSARCTDSVG